jgi:cytoskeleton protein RodZ
MSETQSSDAEQSPPSLGPGDRLQAARISIGLTLDDVASKMHLSASILSSLEDNNFEDITAPIFVKGYLRSYARIVNLDEEDIIKQYSLYYTHNDPPISSTSNASPQINADDSHVKGLTWLVIIVLIGLLSFWWWNRYHQPAQSVSLETTKNSEIIADSEQGSNSEAMALPEQGTQELDQAQQQNDSLPEISQNNTSDSDAVQQDARNELNGIDDILAETAPQPENDSAAEAAPDNEAVDQTSENPIADQAADLVITVNADTWADIKDADGNRLVYDLLRNGQHLSLSGKAPFNAFLGNGYGVNIQYRGKNIDLSNNIRADNTARIKIGQ